jgi:hypothetical protein
MEGQTPDAAFERINAALARIEAAAVRARPDDEHLAARHAHLRAAVADSLRALDGLIEAQDQ